MSSPHVAELRDRAREARNRNHLEAAVELYHQLEALEPDEPAWSKSAAECYGRLGNAEAELAALERAASRYAARGFVVRAIAMCKMILTRQPGHTRTLETLDALQGRRVMGVDRFRRGTASPLESGSLQNLAGARRPPDLDDAGVIDIPLELAREPRPARDGIELEALAASPLFALAAPDALRRLVADVELVELATNDVLYRDGDPSDTMFVVVDGSVHLRTAAPTIAELGPGEVLGVIGLVANEPRPLTAVATMPTRLLALHRRSLAALLREVDGLREAIIDLARQRLLAAVLATHPVFARVAAADRDRLLERFRLFEVATGACLIGAGRVSHYLLVILTGRYSARGRTLGVGDLVGAEAITSGAAETTAVTATSGGFVLALHRDDFHAIVGDDGRRGRDTSRIVIP